MPPIETFPVNGRAIRNARMKRGLSQRQLGALAGVAQSRISAAEHGSPLGELTLHRIANALKLSPDDLQSEKEAQE